MKYFLTRQEGILWFCDYELFQSNHPLKVAEQLHVVDDHFEDGSLQGGSEMKL